MSQVNAHSPLVTSAEVDKMTHFVAISHLSPATPLIAQWAHEPSVSGSRMECVHGHSNMNNHSPRLTGFSHCWEPNLTAAKPSTQSPVWHCCLEWPTSYFDGRMIALYGFYQGRGSVWYLMEWILTLNMDFLSIPAMLLQKKTTICNLTECLVHCQDSYTLSLPLKDLIHSKRSVAMLMEFTGLTFLPQFT